MANNMVGNVTNSVTNSVANNAVDAGGLAEKCAGLKAQLIAFIEIFLWVAVIVAILTALIEVLTKLLPLFRKETGFAPRPAVVPTDPVKFADALKALIEAFTKAPTWIALLFAAVLLLFASKELMPAFC